MEGKREKESSTRAWYLTYQVYTTINKNYERVTEAGTHEIPKLYALKREKKERVPQPLYKSSTPPLHH